MLNIFSLYALNAIYYITSHALYLFLIFYNYYVDIVQSTLQIYKSTFAIHIYKIYL